MDLLRWQFLTDCKKEFCGKQPCGLCPLEDFCLYNEDVDVEAYAPGISIRMRYSALFRLSGGESVPKVVFDWDGVFTRQVPYLCFKLGIPIPNAYHVKDATNLTRDQQERLFDAYQSDMAYKGVPFVEGVTRALSLPCAPYVYSGNTTERMAEYKRSVIKELAPDFPESHIILSSGTEKPPLDNVNVYVEDGVHYLEQYPESTIKILIDYPYNKDAPADIIRVHRLNEAVDLIEKLLQSCNH